MTETFVSEIKEICTKHGFKPEKVLNYYAVRNFEIRAQYRAHRQNGMNRQSAIYALEENYPISFKTIERITKNIDND